MTKNTFLRRSVAFSATVLVSLVAQLGLTSVTAGPANAAGPVCADRLISYAAVGVGRPAAAPHGLEAAVGGGFQFPAGGTTYPGTVGCTSDWKVIFPSLTDDYMVFDNGAAVFDAGTDNVTFTFDLEIAGAGGLYRIQAIDVTSATALAVTAGTAGLLSPGQPTGYGTNFQDNAVNNHTQVWTANSTQAANLRAGGQFAILFGTMGTTGNPGGFDLIKGGALTNYAPRPNSTVAYNANNGVGTMADQTTNTATNLRTNTFTRAGFKFAGWNTEALGGGTPYAAGARYSFAASTTLFAQWVSDVSVTTVAPTSGTALGGTSITITGTNFVEGATVTVGGAACTDVVVVSATSITCATPAGTVGLQDLVVTNEDGGTDSLSDAFTYISSPTAATVEPNFGSSEGATAITITGTNFAAGATVTVGGAACTDVVVVSATSITCVTPAGTLGAKDVVITNADGGTVTSLNGFTYNRPFRAVTFNANGGTGSIAAVSNNASAKLPANTLVRSGYLFKGWNTTAKGTGTSYADKGSYSFNSDVTLYAQWTLEQTEPKLKRHISTFAGDNADLTMGMQKMIATLAKKLPKKANITCVGSTSGAKVTDFDKKLASSRAMSVCAGIVKLRKDVKYTLKVNPSSSTAIASRSVWVHLK